MYFIYAIGYKPKKRFRNVSLFVVINVFVCCWKVGLNFELVFYYIYSSFFASLLRPSSPANMVLHCHHVSGNYSNYSKIGAKTKRELRSNYRRTIVLGSWIFYSLGDYTNAILGIHLNCMFQMQVISCNEPQK